MYDVIIIGTGPAGLCAAIYARRARLHTLLLEKNYVSGGQILNTAEVDNYPGLPGITGQGLADAMKEHVKKEDVSVTKAQVLEICIHADTGLKEVVTDKGSYEGKTVLIAAGARHRKLKVPGEEELAGMGVSYCATCDGAFYRDRVAAVAGGGNTAVEEALLLARICKKVYLIHRREELRADKALQEALNAAENIEVCWNSVVESIDGEEEVNGVTLYDKKEDRMKTLAVEGIFIAIGIVPNTEVFQGLVKMDEAGYVIAGEDGRTSVPGIYAAGDIRTKELRQIITAASDGANAVASIQKDLFGQTWK